MGLLGIVVFEGYNQCGQSCCRCSCQVDGFDRLRRGSLLADCTRNFNLFSSEVDLLHVVFVGQQCQLYARLVVLEVSDESSSCGKHMQPISRYTHDMGRNRS